MLLLTYYKQQSNIININDPNLQKIKLGGILVVNNKIYRRIQLSDNIIDDFILETFNNNYLQITNENLDYINAHNHFNILLKNGFNLANDYIKKNILFGENKPINLPHNIKIISFYIDILTNDLYIFNPISGWILYNTIFEIKPIPINKFSLYFRGYDVICDASNSLSTQENDFLTYEWMCKDGLILNPKNKITKIIFDKSDIYTIYLKITNKFNVSIIKKQTICIDNILNLFGDNKNELIFLSIEECLDYLSNDNEINKDKKYIININKSIYTNEEINEIINLRNIKHKISCINNYNELIIID